MNRGLCWNFKVSHQSQHSSGRPAKNIYLVQKSIFFRLENAQKEISLYFIGHVFRSIDIDDN